MKKRFKEGKTVLRPAGTLNKVLVFFLLATNLFAQIPLNGFCRVNQLNIPRGFSDFKIINIDDDPEEEIILIGSPQKRFVVINETEEGFSVSPKFFFFPLSDFGLFNSQEPLGDFYLFVSEKNRKMGLTSFTKNGSMILLNQKSLDSYPAKFLIGDINKDGKNEAVIFGNNFNGLSIVVQENYKVFEEKIIKNKIFSDLKFIDLDYDGFPDLAAIDLIANSIVLLMNDNNGNYKLTRTIPFRQNIKNLTVLDFNGDDFTDISFSADNSVVILFGDSVSSFMQTKTIDTPENIYKYGFSDLNNDGTPDLVYIDENKKDCYLKLSGEKGYAESFLFNGGKVITGFNKGELFNSGLQLISPEGKLYGFSKFELSDSVAIKMGGEINIFYTDDLNSDKHPDFYFIDSYDNTLKTLTGKGSEYFTSLFVDDLVEEHNRLDLFKNSNSQVEFHCYSVGGRLVEILNRDFTEAKVKREAVYSSFPIISVVAHSDSSIAVLEKNNDSLLVENFNRVNEHFVNSDINLIDTNFIAEPVSIEKNGIVYYYVRDEEGIFFKKYNPTKKNKYAIDLSKVLSTGNSVISQVAAILNVDKNESFHFINGKEADAFLFVKNKKIINLMPEGEEIPLSVKDNSDLKIYENNKNKAYIYLYDEKSNYIYGAELFKKKKKIVFEKVMRINNVASFYIMQLNNTKYFVYSDSLENTIKFRKLND